ncbi:MAG: hypothetical protein ACLQLG_18645 [Thermoguttaceae bacterium]
MPPLNAASTPADIEAAYLNNSNYEADQSVPEAQAFMQACRCILLRRPARASRNTGSGGQSMDWDLEAVRMQLNEARQWLAYAPAATQTRGGGITHPSFVETRDYGAGDGATGGEYYGTG